MFIPLPLCLRITQKLLRVVSFKFPKQMREGMGAVPAILGTNVIGQANWIFDLVKNKWTLKKFVQK